MLCINNNGFASKQILLKNVQILNFLICKSVMTIQISVLFTRENLPKPKADFLLKYTSMFCSI